MKITNIFKDKGQLKTNLKTILWELNKIANESKILCICLNNTGSAYLGVKNATKNLFPKNTLILPAYFSNILISKKGETELCEKINNYNFQQIILSGQPSSMNFLVDNCFKFSKIKTIFHGALTEIFEYEKGHQFKKIISQLENKKLNSISFVKSGLAEWIFETYKLPSFFIQLNNEINEPLLKSNQIKKIGIFGSNNLNKNIINQIASAISIKNTEIHTFSKTSFFENHKKVVLHNKMNHNNFKKLLSEMDINLHLSFSEGMGGQIFTESLSLGVPCLSSYNNDFLTHNKYLSNLLYVKKIDNPIYIKDSIIKVFKEEKMKLQKELKNHIILKNKEAHHLLNFFLDY